MDGCMDGWMLRHGRPVVRSRLHAAPSDRPPAAAAGCARLRVAACGVLPACSRVAVTLAPPSPRCAPHRHAFHHHYHHQLSLLPRACLPACQSHTPPYMYACLAAPPTHPPTTLLLAVLVDRHTHPLHHSTPATTRRVQLAGAGTSWMPRRGGAGPRGGGGAGGGVVPHVVAPSQRPRPPTCMHARRPSAQAPPLWASLSGARATQGIRLPVPGTQPHHPSTSTTTTTTTDRCWPGTSVASMPRLSQRPFFHTPALHASTTHPPARPHRPSESIVHGPTTQPQLLYIPQRCHPLLTPESRPDEVATQVPRSPLRSRTTTRCSHVDARFCAHRTRFTPSACRDTAAPCSASC